MSHKYASMDYSVFTPTNVWGTVCEGRHGASKREAKGFLQCRGNTREFRTSALWSLDLSPNIGGKGPSTDTLYKLYNESGVR